MTLQRIPIGFDASCTLAPRRGIGRAAIELLRAMVARLNDKDDPDERFELRVLMNSLTRWRGVEHAFLDAPNVRVSRTMRPGPWMVGAWRDGKGPGAEELLGDDLALFHGPASYMPPARRAKRVVTVHDLAFLETPPRDREKLGAGYFAGSFPTLLPKCDLILTPSVFVKNQVAAVFGVADERIRAVPWGLDHDLFRVVDQRFAEIASHECGLPGPPYLLGVSDHTPRKRPGLLLDVYARLREAEPATPRLLVLGWDGKPHRELMERQELHRHVTPAPALADRFLPGLYTGAAATIIASAHEGFGFPVIEAMACGSPVVCARRSALVETGGDVAQFVDSDDPDAWVTAIRAVAFDQKERDLRREAGIKHASRYTWDACARATLDAYAAVLS